MLFFHTAGERKNYMTLQAYKGLLGTSCRLCQPDQTRPEQTKISDCFGADYLFKCRWSNWISAPWTVKFVSFMFGT